MKWAGRGECRENRRTGRPPGKGGGCQRRPTLSRKGACTCGWLPKRASAWHAGRNSSWRGPSTRRWSVVAAFLVPTKEGAVHACAGCGSIGRAGRLLAPNGWRATPVAAKKGEAETKKGEAETQCGAHGRAFSCPCRQRRPGADGPASLGSRCAASSRCVSPAGTAASSLLPPRRLRTGAPLPSGVLGCGTLRAASTSSQGAVRLGIFGNHRSPFKKSSKAQYSSVNCRRCQQAARYRACLVPGSGKMPAACSAAASDARSCNRCSDAGINSCLISFIRASALIICPMGSTCRGGGGRQTRLAAVGRRGERWAGAASGRPAALLRPYCKL